MHIITELPPLDRKLKTMAVCWRVMARYFEVWIDQTKKAEVIKKLKEICEEVHEVFYDYDVIVRVSEMEEKDLLKN